MTPLYVAACNGHEEVVSLLLEKGADRGVKSKVQQTSSLIVSRIVSLAVESIFIFKCCVNSILLSGFPFSCPAIYLPSYV
jgi:hypothetical protein